MLYAKSFVGTSGDVMDHENFMRRAIELASNVPEHPFGAVIVDQASAEILAEGWNQSSINPTWHGEVDAINRLFDSGEKRASRSLALYSTAEPCPMCQAAIQWVGIETVVYGSSIKFLQQLGRNQIDISAEEVVSRTPFHDCTLIGGILEEECNALFR